MGLFKKIKDSIYSPNYYASIPGKAFSRSLKYYLLFALLISFVSMVFLLITVVPKIKFFLDIFSEKVLEYYPDELEIVIKDGKASTNVQEPYFIKAPPEWEKGQKDLNKEIPGIENLLAIDTKNPFSIERFKAYNAFCYLSEESLACYDEQQAIKVTLLKEARDMTINKNLVSSFVGRVKPFFWLVYPVSADIIWLGAFFVLLLRLIYLLPAALLIWLVAKIKKVEIGYKKSYQVGLHAMTLPIIIAYPINYLLSFLKADISFPFFFTMLLLIMVALNLKSKNMPGDLLSPLEATP